MSDPTYRCSKCDRERENCSCVTKQPAPTAEDFKIDAMKLLEARERITVLEDLLDHYRADFTAAFKEVERLRGIVQDNA